MSSGIWEVSETAVLLFLFPSAVFCWQLTVKDLTLILFTGFVFCALKLCMYAPTNTALYWHNILYPNLYWILSFQLHGLQLTQCLIFQIKWLWNFLCQVNREERGILVSLKEELKFLPVPDVCHTFMWRMRQDIRHQLILTFPQPTARSCHVAVLSSKGWTLAGGCYFLLKLASLALKISTYENTKNVFLLFRGREKNV